MWDSDRKTDGWEETAINQLSNYQNIQHEIEVIRISELLYTYMKVTGTSRHYDD
jgi:hypothetical protein